MIAMPSGRHGWEGRVMDRPVSDWCRMEWTGT